MFQESAQPSPIAPSYVPGSKTWIIVTDGSRARVFESTGREGGIYPAFATDFYLSCESLGAAPSRRTFDPAALPFALGPSTPGAKCPKRAFAAALVRALETSLTEQRFDRLVLVAPPQVLDELGGALSSPLRMRVAAEVRRDLMHVGSCELPAYLGSALHA